MLKSCPKCGTHPVITSNDKPGGQSFFTGVGLEEDFEGGFFVYCGMCDLRTLSYVTQDEATLSWEEINF
jgi:hypothetical protein